MPATLSTRERMTIVYNHEEPDCLPRHDSPWPATVRRWHSEGLPKGVTPREFFDWDTFRTISADVSPRFPVETIEETDEYEIFTTNWGSTLKNFKTHSSVPEFLEHRIVDRDSWAEAKERLVPSEDRVDWKYLEENWPIWEAEGAWINGHVWFGYEVFASWVSGTERVLMAMVEDPEWIRDMIDATLELNLAVLSVVWDRGYRFQAIHWCDDMGYRNGPFFSVDTYRAVEKPAQKRLVDWCHDRGIVANMHSCGDIRPLVPELVEICLDGLNPLEQKAGMDVFDPKKQYGDVLTLEGGIDVRSMTDGVKIEEEIREKFEVLKPGGGYIYFSDHSIPSDVSFADYCRVLELVKYYGKY